MVLKCINHPKDYSNSGVRNSILENLKITTDSSEKSNDAKILYDYFRKVSANEPYLETQKVPVFPPMGEFSHEVSFDERGAPELSIMTGEEN
ncbi:MAG: hypothetical protein AABX10_03650 [Nanoarchaeota archaeon]